MKAYIKFPYKPGHFADLVDIIPSGKNLTEEQHKRYYAGDSKVKLTSTIPTRLVFRRDNGDYIVMPDIPRNRRFWRIE